MNSDPGVGEIVSGIIAVLCLLVFVGLMLFVIMRPIGRLISSTVVELKKRLTGEWQREQDQLWREKELAMQRAREAAKERAEEEQRREDSARRSEDLRCYGPFQCFR